jgi:hypothetical protein
MAEQDQPTSHSGASHDPIKAHSTFNSEGVKQDGPIHEVRGGIATEPDVGLEETDQQPVEKSTAARPDTSQRDPKLVHLCCLPFYAGETNQPHR